MKIKVGEFVRLSRNQGINKIIDEDDDGFLILDEMIADEYGDECFEISLQDVDSEITKHSFNITDLIEVGDIVFIQDVLNNDFVYIYDDEMLKAVKQDIEEGLEITQILTHEQFEANCYKVKGEIEV